MGPAGAGERFCQTNLGFSNGGLGLSLALVPRQYWPWLLGWGRVEETSKCKISEERNISLNETLIYGYDSKESGTVGPR